MSYKFWFSSLLDIVASFKRLVHISLNEFVGLHLYLDNLIVCAKGLMITSDFQVFGPFQIDFVLDTNSYILKDLQEKLFSYSANNPHLKYCEGLM